MNNLIATYRLQFHKEFTFKDFERIIPYLKKIGVSTIYASPILEAVPGSNHGYDGINPDHINPEIGTEEQLRKISADLKKETIGWLQDIVPNHMAFHPKNTWLMDVLEKGTQSLYAPFFDIDWSEPLMVPFLGNTLEEVIANGELKINYGNQRFQFCYYDPVYPLNLRSYEEILKTTDQSNQLNQFLVQIRQLHQVEDSRIFAEEWQELHLQLAALIKNKETNKFIQNRIEAINSDQEKLRQIAEQQFYRLCHWQETDSRINYRRFFTVNGLICLNIQNEEVFQQYHRYINYFLKTGVFQGLRIDHIDGLFNPKKYLEELRKIAGDNTYIVVEKILEPKEKLPADWPVQGNTGYDFLAAVNNLFTNRSSRGKFTRFYQKLTHESISVKQHIYKKKAYILYQHMEGELNNLCKLFTESHLPDRAVLNQINPSQLKNTIAEFLIQCPVYRYYGNEFPLNQGEAIAVKQILNRIEKNNAQLSEAVGLLRRVFLEEPQHADQEYKNKVTYFYQRCMQFTGPLMAKGVEDTLMYAYNPFIAHNEVGDSPEVFGYSINEFHQQMVERQQEWSLTLNATTTHDTKRGEDFRARLSILGDLPDDWLQCVEEWQQLNAELKINNLPDTNDEYFIYQTLAGAYPVPEQDDSDFEGRLCEYLEKAFREAKRQSDWTEPNEEYEETVKGFAIALLDKDKPFWKSFEAFHHRIVDFGLINSLTQVLLKFTCPGTPDVYQGCEVWNFSFVDPDNRRPVDYTFHLEMLKQIEAGISIEELWGKRYGGQIKLWLMQQLFKLRQRETILFSEGEYIPLKVGGRYKDYVIAYLRKYKNTCYLVAVPLGLARLCEQQQSEIMSFNWEDTIINLPSNISGEWENVLCGLKGKHKGEIQLNSIFKSLPFALLQLKPLSERGAGVLLSVTSLPSDFGIGDFGPHAKVFVDFLHRSGQKYWQLLPLNPIEESAAYSPYSSYSSMAGNTWLISLELLVDEGLLYIEDIRKNSLKSLRYAEYKKAELIKDKLLEKSYHVFCKEASKSQQSDFQDFIGLEAYWLNDFALYVLLKELYKRKPWYEWPKKYKNRENEALHQLAFKYAEDLNKIKWQQFIFFKQWRQLKAYCNEKNIRLIGDVPFYISYDSADVWAHPEIFSLDEKGGKTAVAGVPPDYFNEDGQLWGMPIFRWDVLKKRNYDWWIQRLRKNFEMYDLVRLDHFRAFSAYWEVPADAKTARNGQWKPGPGSDFFRQLSKELGELPFIAEDLGDIDDAVYKLRDEFNLPGMKVLQFAFGDDVAQSLNSPHNYTSNFVVYSGTHDNNTVVGWFCSDLDQDGCRRLMQYTGMEVTKQNAHQVLMRLAYASVAKIAIIPMQDILGLDENSRMNTPASIENNWLWRFTKEELTSEIESQLHSWTSLFNR